MTNSAEIDWVKRKTVAQSVVIGTFFAITAAATS
jgi:hypothetical protein